MREAQSNFLKTLKGLIVLKKNNDEYETIKLTYLPFLMHVRKEDKGEEPLDQGRSGSSVLHIMATKTPMIAFWFFLGFLVFVQPCRSSSNVGAALFTSANRQSHVNLLRMSDDVLFRIDAMLSEVR